MLHGSDAVCAIATISLLFSGGRWEARPCKSKSSGLCHHPKGVHGLLSIHTSQCLLGKGPSYAVRFIQETLHDSISSPRNAIMIAFLYIRYLSLTISQ